MGENIKGFERPSAEVGMEGIWGHGRVLINHWRAPGYESKEMKGFKGVLEKLAVELMILNTIGCWGRDSRFLC